MDRIITLTAFLVLISVFAFGQKQDFKIYEDIRQSKIETRLNELNHDNHSIEYPHFYQKSKKHSQSLGLKSTQDIKQGLDSTILENWDATNSQLVNSTKEEFTYEINGNLSQSIFSLWDETITHWVYLYKDEFTYEINGNLSQSITYLWDDINSLWIFNYKSESEYDMDGHITQSFGFIWDEINSQWVILSKIEFTYDEYGYRSQFISFSWDEINSQWVYDYKYEYEYSDNGNQIQYIRSNWDENISQWVYSSKREYVFDDNGNNTQSISSDWDDIVSQWIYDRKFEFSYDEDGNKTQSISSDWDDIVSQWIWNWKSDYQFSNSGNRIITTRFYWDLYNTQQWIIKYKVEYNYDDTYPYSDLILPYYMNSILMFNHMLINIMDYTWDEEVSDWEEPNRRRTYYYSEHYISSVPEIYGEEIKVYPNPFSEYITFSIPENHNPITFELFDMQGRMIMSDEIRSDEKINMENLNQGVYFYNLIIDDKKLTGKLIKS